MAKKEKGGHSPYEPYKPAPSGPYTKPPKKIASAKNVFSTPYHDDLRNINKFRENADKVFKRKKQTNNPVNEA